MRFNNLPSVFKPARSSKLDSASRKTPKSRKLGLEGLEDRRLLSVSTAEFEAIRDAYAALDLPKTASELNVLEIAPSDLSYESVTRAIERAASTPEDDLIVLRTDGARYQLDLGAANFSINVDSSVSGSVSLASFGARALQIASSSPEGVFNVSSGDVGLAGFALVGFSSSGAANLITVDAGASVASDSLTLLTRTAANVGGYDFAVQKDADGPDRQDEFGAVPFTLIGSNDYYAVQGLSNQQEFGQEPAQESWSVDFQYSETERGFLAGLSTEEAILITTGTGSYQTSVFYDADKGRARNDGDDNLCWAGTASNMLYYSGWAPQSIFPDEQIVFDVFIENFNDKGGRSYYGNGWFIAGNRYDYFNYLFDPTTENAGFYASQLSSYGESYTTYAEEIDLDFSVDGMNSLADHIQNGYAIGLGIDWTCTSCGGGSIVRSGGHAITCWGYTYNTSLQNTDPNYYTRLFVTDSDDYQSEARKLQDYGIFWSPESDNGYNTGYIFETYGYSGEDSFGFLRDFSYLAQKPAKYVFEGEPRLARPSLTVTSEGNTVTATFGAVAGAAGYVLEYSSDRTFAESEILTFEEPSSYTFSDLPKGTVIYLRVKATAPGHSDSAWTRGQAVTPLDPDAYEPNNTRSAAYDLGTASGVLTVNANVHKSGDVDYYRFTIDAVGDEEHYVQATYEQTSGFDIDLRLYDADGNQLAVSQKETGTEYMSLEGLAAGDYYVYVYNYRSDPGVYSLEICAPDSTSLSRPTFSVFADAPTVEITIGAVANAAKYVLQYGTDEAFETYTQKEYTSAGTYSLTGFIENETYYFRVKATAPGWNDSRWNTASAVIVDKDEFEPNDVRSEAYDLGTLTEFFSVSTLSLHDAEDIDWIKFTTGANGTADNYIRITYEHSSCFDLDFGLYNADGNRVLYSSAMSGVEYKTLENLPKGSYYLKIYNYETCDEGQTYLLEIAPPAPLGPNELDFPLVSVASYDLTSISLKIGAVDGAESYVVQYGTDSSFETYSEVSYSSSGTYAITGLSQATTYYFRVKAAAPGHTDSAWTTLSAGTISPPDQYEPNNTRSAAYDLGSISGVKTVDAEADSDRAYDWFKFTTVGEGTSEHTIRLSHDYEYGAADVDIALYASDGTWLASSTRSSSPETIRFEGLAAGTYYVRIYNYYTNSASVPYTLSFNLPQKSITLSTSEPRFGKIVTTTLKPADGTATWQWYRVDDSGAATAISGKTNSYYTPVAADVGYRLRVVANSKGTTAQATSASVVTRDLTSVTMNNAGTNPTVGTRIVTYVAPSTGTATYQWFRIDSTGTETAIPDATGYAYTPVEADAGCYL
ncbi:MAG: pre-peptidase C-terminal domain-containing protein, partial [Thermoguttaceae bacterium]|nr:pre-peptidase C-terminal domain-containing protein [Thermoguttaceae bacterium]